MIGFNHAVMGAIIAASVKQPAVALPLAFASHFVLDALPHYGVPTERRKIYKSFYRILASDALITFALGILLLATKNYQACAGAFLALSPDVVWLPRFLKEHLFEAPPSLPADPFSRFHKKIQWGERPWAWPIDLVWAVLSFVLLLQLIR